MRVHLYADHEQLSQYMDGKVVVGSVKKESPLTDPVHVDISVSEVVSWNHYPWVQFRKNEGGGGDE